MVVHDTLLPMYLRGCDAYQEYIRAVQAGEMTLPTYQTDPDGQNAITYHGELFCRVPGCPRAKFFYWRTYQLRGHLLKKHGLTMEEGPGGRPGKAEVHEAVTWYQSLLSKDAEDAEEEQGGDEQSQEQNQEEESKK